MKSCPGCEFLIDDALDTCEFCAADPGYAAKLKGFTTKTVVGALADSDVEVSGSVGLLERPVPSAVNWEETDVTPKEKPGPSLLNSNSKSSTIDDLVEIRRSRKPVSLPVVGGVIGLILLAVAAASVLGHGPLAGEFAKLGLTTIRSEVLPSDWVISDDVAGTFTVEMPVGAEVVFEALDPKGVAPGGLVGAKTTGDKGAYVFAGSSDLGLGSAGLKAMDSETGLAELTARYGELRIPGKMTVNRSLLLANGHANDSVWVSRNSDGTATETRMRTIMTGDRIYQLITAGPDSAAKELDAAHRRLIGSFVINPQ
ncbi:MAG: hypothetical protein KDB26_15005 [Microthrixaceae bacterium]|nr:hypothetical protein [Microthrixaceae bacterium]